MRRSLLAALVFLHCFSFGQQQKHYNVIAYYTGDGDSINKYPVQHLTHIIYSFLQFQNDTLGFFNDKQRNAIRQLVLLKKDHPQLKVMVSIGGWGGCASCSDLFASAEKRNSFAVTVVKFLKQNDVDGLDLDWEYPAIAGYPGHKYDTADKRNFTELVKALRKEMGNKYLLSFAAGAFINYLEHSVDWAEVMPLVNFVNLMTYDLVGGYSTVTGHHTPLADYKPGQESTQKCVTWLLDHKIKSRKLIIGAAFYARVWENVDSSNLGLYQPGNFLRGVSYKDFPSYFCDSAGFKYCWDAKAKAPFQYSQSKRLFATFDDERSVKEKAKFVRQEKLGGIMFWQLLDDSYTAGLTTIIRKALEE